MNPSVVLRKPQASMRAACSVLILTLVLVSSPGMAEEGDGGGERTRSPAGAIELPVIEVIATTPLPALGTPLHKVPANVQSLTAEDVEEQNPLDLSEMLFDNIGSVNINAARTTPSRTIWNTAGSWPRRWSAAPSGYRCIWMACASTKASATPSTGT